LEEGLDKISEDEEEPEVSGGLPDTPLLEEEQAGHEHEIGNMGPKPEPERRERTPSPVYDVPFGVPSPSLSGDEEEKHTSPVWDSDEEDCSGSNEEPGPSEQEAEDFYDPADEEHLFSGPVTLNKPLDEPTEGNKLDQEATIAPFDKDFRSRTCSPSPTIRLGGRQRRQVLSLFSAPSYTAWSTRPTPPLTKREDLLSGRSSDNTRAPSPDTESMSSLPPGLDLSWLNTSEE
jgi:hypothetical protein